MIPARVSSKLALPPNMGQSTESCMRIRMKTAHRMLANGVWRVGQSSSMPTITGSWTRPKRPCKRMFWETHFGQCCSGPYVVRQVSRPLWTSVSPPPGEGHVVTVDSGGTSVGHDFGNLPPAIVFGRVYHDTNANGSNDVCDSGIAATVYADANDNGAMDDGEYRAATDSTGKYQLDVAPGTYKIRTTDTWIVSTCRSRGWLSRRDDRKRRVHPEP